MPSAYRFCKYCGRELPKGKTLNFCPYCGKKLPQLPTADTTPPVAAPTVEPALPTPPITEPAPKIISEPEALAPEETAAELPVAPVALPAPAVATPAPEQAPKAATPAQPEPLVPASDAKPRAEHAAKSRAERAPNTPKTPPKAGDLVFAVLSALIILSAVCVSVYYLTPLAAIREDVKILEQADMFLAENDLDSAIAAVSALSYPGEYHEQISAVYYAAAMEAFSQQDYDIAIEYFDLCPDYADSALQAAQCHYQLGILAMDYDMFDIAVHGGRDSYSYTANSSNFFYVIARQLADYDGLEKAIAHFDKAGDYANAREFYVKSCNMLGERAYWKEDYEKAIECFTLSGAAIGIEKCEQLKAAEQQRCAQYGERLKYGYYYDTNSYDYYEYALFDDIYAASLTDIYNNHLYVDKAYARRDGNSLAITVFLNTDDIVFYTARSYTDGGETDYFSEKYPCVDYCSGSVPGVDDVFSFTIDAESITNGECQLNIDFYFSLKSSSPDFSLSFDNQQLLRIAKGN